MLKLRGKMGRGLPHDAAPVLPFWIPTPATPSSPGRRAKSSACNSHRWLRPWTCAWEGTLRSARRHRRQKACAGSRRHRCAVTSPELRSTEERAGRSPFARCFGERSCRVAMAGEPRVATSGGPHAAVSSCMSASRRRHRVVALSLSGAKKSGGDGEMRTRV